MKYNTNFSHYIIIIIIIFISSSLTSCHKTLGNLITDKKVLSLWLTVDSDIAVEIKDKTNQDKILGILKSIKTQNEIQEFTDLTLPLHSVKVSFDGGTGFQVNFNNEKMSFTEFNSKTRYFSLKSKVPDAFKSIYEKNKSHKASLGKTPSFKLNLSEIIYAIDSNYLGCYDNSGIKVIDLSKNKTIKTIKTKLYDVKSLDIYKDKVVWSELENQSNKKKLDLFDKKRTSNIFLYDLKSKKTIKITDNPSFKYNPCIWKNYIAWMDARNDKKLNNDIEWDIYLYDLNTCKEKLISTIVGSNTIPSIDNYKVVFESTSLKNNSSASSTIPMMDKDIYMYDIKKDTLDPIATSMITEESPSISGNYVVFTKGDFSTSTDIMLYNTLTRTTKNISNELHYQGSPKIYGDYVVWMDERRGIKENDVFANGNPPNSDIFLYNIQNKTEKLLTGPLCQLLPDISSKWVVYEQSQQLKTELQVINYRE